MKQASILLSFCALASLGGCNRATQDEATKTVQIHHTMEKILSAEAQSIWDVGNHAMNGAGDIDAALMTDDGWARVANAGRQMELTATQLADAKAIIVAPPGQKIDEEGEPGAAGAVDVQRYIDADRAGFSDLARALAMTGRDATQAARDKDIKQFSSVVSGLDGVCEACHKRFWFPE